MGVDPTRGGMSTVGQRPQDNLAPFSIVSLSTTKAIKRETQRDDTGATAAPTPTNHSTAYPGGGASQQKMAVASLVFQPARSVKRHPRTERSSQNTEDTLKTSIAASPSLFRAWRFRAPCAHPSGPENDRFLAYAAKNERG